MTDSTVLLPGVDRHGAGFRVRMRFGAHRHIETGFPTADEANARVITLRAMRDAGLTPTTQARVDQTLRDAAEALLVRKRTTVSRKTKRPLRASGIEWWERATRPWREGHFATLPLSLLRFDQIEDALLERAATTAKTARDEQDGLKATLRYAGQRGARFDQALLNMERLQVTPRQRVALDGYQLELLAAHAPDYAQRMLLFAGTTGMRIGELFSMTDERLDLRERTVFVPAALCKEGVDKWVDLTAEEVTLAREQRLARAPGTPLFWPTKTGKPWRHFQFLRLVWYKARSRASTAWREQHELPAEAETPFEWWTTNRAGEPTLTGIQPHDLRATAATMMRDAGFTKEQAAARLGHADSGQLLDRIYDVGDRRARMRRAIHSLAPEGLRATLAEPTPQPSDSPAAEGSTNLGTR